METTIIQRLKENLAQRAQGLSEFLRQTSPQVLKMRTGSVGEQAVNNELSLLNTVMQKAENQTLGICEVCGGDVDTSRLEMDYTASVCIEHLSSEERSRLENDLELSAKVQKALLPNVLPKIQNVEVAAFSQPARIVGGDYFDFLRCKDGAHALVIADVMGKGMPASMLMASLQASLRIIAPESNEPADIVSRLNHLFCHNIRLTNFVTLFLAKFDETTRTLMYCNAGHNPPLIQRNNGAVEYMNPTGAAIGLVEQTAFEQGQFKLEAGDRVLLYTDGVVESFSPEKEIFGEERLEEYFRSSAGKSSQQIINGLKEILRTFTGNAAPADDTTIIALSVKE